MVMINRNYVYETANKSFTKLSKKQSGRNCRQFGQRVWGGKFLSKKSNYLDRCLNGEEISTEMWFDMPGEGRQCFEINYIPYCDNNGAITRNNGGTQHNEAQDSGTRA